MDHSLSLGRTGGPSDAADSLVSPLPETRVPLRQHPNVRRVEQQGSRKAGSGLQNVLLPLLLLTGARYPILRFGPQLDCRKDLHSARFAE